jgi:hypothetical protein
MLPSSYCEGFSLHLDGMGDHRCIRPALFTGAMLGGVLGAPGAESAVSLTARLST